MTDSANKSKRITKWADDAMYVAEPSPAESGPTVTLLNCTPDPLGAIAAATLIYEGKVIRSLAGVTDVDRKRCLAQLQKTRLQSPFEYVDFHFLIEGVTRSFTHQLVRQRVGASYSQESLRFAVKEDAASAVALPPYLAGVELDDDTPWKQASDMQRQLRRWKEAVGHAAESYQSLVDNGMPAEDARGLLPHSITTRIHYKTTLRGLLEHAGNRLCTQSQQEWRLVISQLVKSIRNYQPPNDSEFYNNEWQYKKLAEMFLPICFQTGKCEFKASFDRPCRIRDKVDAHAAKDEHSSTWNDISPIEWLADGGARGSPVA